MFAYVYTPSYIYVIRDDATGASGRCAGVLDAQTGLLSRDSHRLAGMVIRHAVPEGAFHQRVPLDDALVHPAPCRLLVERQETPYLFSDHIKKIEYRPEGPPDEYEEEPPASYSLYPPMSIRIHPRSS